MSRKYDMVDEYEASTSQWHINAGIREWRSDDDVIDDNIIDDDIKNRFADDMSTQTLMCEGKLIDFWTPGLTASRSDGIKVWRHHQTKEKRQQIYDND